MATPAAALKQGLIETAEQILANEPNGLRNGVLRQRIREKLPDLPTDVQIITRLRDYMKEPGVPLYRPVRGRFLHKKFPPPPPPPVPKYPESAFYRPFADWLVEDVEECTAAVSVGGPKLKGKFGTPDVVGIWRPSPGDIIQSPIEVVSAEVKISGDGLITAFGQACSYRLFSHKSYIVIPNTLSEDENAERLESLCVVFGIGLVLFNPDSPDDPQWEIRNRATKHAPDMYYVNEKLKLIAGQLGLVAAG